jgi:quercetin dioxygenase-like cupin family protein
MSSDPTKDWIQLAPGVKRQTCAVGEKMMQVIVHYDKGAKVPEHAHVHEQLVSVLAGTLMMTIAGQPQEVAQGDAIALKSNVPHSAEALEETWVLDTFTPLREDILKQDAEHKK